MKEKLSSVELSAFMTAALEVQAVNSPSVHVRDLERLSSVSYRLLDKFFRQYGASQPVVALGLFLFYPLKLRGKVADDVRLCVAGILQGGYSPQLVAFFSGLDMIYPAPTADACDAVVSFVLRAVVRGEVPVNNHVLGVLSWWGEYVLVGREAELQVIVDLLQAVSSEKDADRFPALVRQQLNK